MPNKHSLVEYLEFHHATYLGYSYVKNPWEPRTSLTTIMSLLTSGGGQAAGAGTLAGMDWLAAGHATGFDSDGQGGIEAGWVVLSP